MIRLVACVVALAACAESSLTSSGSLTITAVTPARIAARGGVRVHIEGQGFAPSARVFLREAEAAVVEHGSDALVVIAPTLIAGRAAVRVEQEGGGAALEDAIDVTPLGLSFLDAPAWTLPALAPPLTGLLAFDAFADGTPEVAAGAKDGLQLLSRSESGGFVARPLGPTPEVFALAVDRESGALAACVADAAAPIRIIDPSSTGAVARADAITTPLACTKVVFVRVDGAGGRWLIAETPTGLAGWRPEGSKFVPAPLETAEIPGERRTLSATDLDADGIEELLVATHADGKRTLALVRFADGANGRRARVERPFPGEDVDGRAFATFDADGDGDADLLSVGDGADALFLNDGHGSFFDDAWRRLPFERGTGRDVAVTDLDLDGRADLVVASASGPDRLFAGGTDAFVDRTPALGLAGPHGASHVVAIDVDHDGDRDVITLDGASGRLRIRLLANVEAP